MRRRQLLQIVAATAAATTSSCVPQCGGAREGEKTALQGGPGSLGSLASPGGSAPGRDGSSAGLDARDDELDRALRLLQDSEPESKQGLSNHAPMVAEALTALGFGDGAASWVEAYRAPLIKLPPPTRRIEREGWRAALGPRRGAETWEAELQRWGDWKAFFAEELAEVRWQDVLSQWTARLAPGLCAAATHGVIRTAHAARALSRRENAERLGELSRGLAYWAAAYEEMPAKEGSGDRAQTYAEALERVPLYWQEHGREPPGNIVNGLRLVGGLRGFGEVRDLVAPR